MTPAETYAYMIDDALDRLNNLHDNYPDFSSPDRAAHERAVADAEDILRKAVERQRRVKNQTMTDESGQVITRYGFPLHRDGTALRIADQWWGCSERCFARIQSPFCCIRRLGGHSTIRQDGKHWIVTLHGDDGWRSTHRCTSYGSAFKIMVRW